MGCDIHTYAERLVDNEWKLITDLPERDYRWDPPAIYNGRNYELFGYLAGVRSNNYAAVKPRNGFPRNASTELKTMYLAWGADAHSACHYRLYELIKFFNNISTKKVIHRSHFTAWLRCLEEFEEISNLSNDDIRFVMWFDS